MGKRGLQRYKVVRCEASVSARYSSSPDGQCPYSGPLEVDGHRLCSVHEKVLRNTRYLKLASGEELSAKEACA